MCSASSFSAELGEQGAKSSGDLIPFPEAESPLPPGRWAGVSTLPCCSSLPPLGLGSQLGPQHHKNSASARWGMLPPREDASGWELQPAGFGICSTARGIDLEAQCTVELEPAQGPDATGALPLALPSTDLLREPFATLGRCCPTRGRGAPLPPLHDAHPTLLHPNPLAALSPPRQ